MKINRIPRQSARTSPAARGQATAGGRSQPGAPAVDFVERVRRLAGNLSWTWSADAQRLFAALDPLEWAASEHAPLRTLARLPAHRRARLEADPAILALLEACEQEQQAELSGASWFDRTARGHDRGLLVAYFCSEYALHESMQQYAGGLGVLAGDHLKSASELGIPLVAVGLLYRSGYYRQSLAPDGSTQVAHPRYDFADWPLVDAGCRIACPLGKRSVAAKVWTLAVGRTTLVLLDADVPENPPRDRRLTQALYQGDPEHRMAQQILLGMGGLLALDALNLRPTVYHLNEGHAAFCGLERLRRLQAGGYPFDDAIDMVRNSSVFTTHTPVPAGHDRYAIPLVRKYFAGLAAELGMAWRDFVALGREDPRDAKEPFCMTVLALRLSRHCNGVARLHGETTRKMWMKLYGAEAPNQVPIAHVTNGVHPRTWLAPEMAALYERYLKPKWVGAGPEDDPWARAGSIPAVELWRTRELLRARLVAFVRERLIRQAQQRGATATEVAWAATALNENALTIGFARRFATYKRAPLILSDARRLARLLNDPRRPVQLIFAGKAHPADLPGQAFVRTIAQFTQRPEFRGKVVLLEDYDMEIGRRMTSGADVWLNNPIRPMEASGTSGMKPPLHGGLNLSVLDGWWPEAFDGSNGWAIGDGRELRSRRAQDRYDAGCLYAALERQVIPKFYARDKSGVPQAWVSMMKRSMKTIGRPFSSHRMLGEYTMDYYLPAHR